MLLPCSLRGTRTPGVHLEYDEAYSARLESWSVERVGSRRERGVLVRLLAATAASSKSSLACSALAFASGSASSLVLARLGLFLGPSPALPLPWSWPGSASSLVLVLLLAGLVKVALQLTQARHGPHAAEPAPG